MAKQTGCILVAISQRRNIITVYKGDLKYILRDSSVILAKANQAIQTLEKYVSVLDRIMINLNLLEFQDLVDRKSTRLNSSHANISYAVFCLKKKTQRHARHIR